jgi:hypothetical protein
MFEGKEAQDKVNEKVDKVLEIELANVGGGVDTKEVAVEDKA